MDFEKYTNSKLYYFFDVLYKLLFINTLWFLTTIIGLGIFTLFPASVTVFVLMKAIIKQQEFPIIKTFYIIFAKVYWKSMKLFLVFLIFIFLLTVDVQFFYKVTVASPTLFHYAAFIVTLLMYVVFAIIYIQSILVLIYFPFLKTFKILKYAIILGIAYPFRSIASLIIYFLFVIILVFRFFIPLDLFLTFSVIAYLVLKLFHNKYMNLVHDKPPIDVEDYI